MKVAKIRLTDGMLLSLMHIKDVRDVAILGVMRAETCTATDITLLHPSLPDLEEGGMPPFISLGDLALKK